MRTSTRLLSLLTAATLAVVPSACDEDAGGNRIIGESCQAANDCQAGICGAGTCLDPAIDSDSDGLLNSVERALKTNPVAQDTDGDGVIDARESALADADGDCIVDELDRLTSKAETDLALLADQACCCGGACSEVAPGAAVTAECLGGEVVLINCGTSAECALGQHCQSPPGRGRCTTIPLMATNESDPLCIVDSDCDPGKVCFAFTLRGTCVLSDGNPPVMPAVLMCDTMEEGLGLQPDCAPPATEL